MAARAVTGKTAATNGMPASDRRPSFTSRQIGIVFLEKQLLLVSVR